MKKAKACVRGGGPCVQPCDTKAPPPPGWSTAPPTSFKSAPSLFNPPFLQSRCIVGKKVVAIRPLRGLRGRSENPEIHYAFKTFIYFRITFILSPGGPARRADDGPSLSGHRRQRSRARFLSEADHRESEDCNIY